MGKPIDGRALAAKLKKGLRSRAAAVARRLRRAPKLAFVVCAEDDAAETYFAQERRSCLEIGVEAVELRVPPRRGEAALIGHLRNLSSSDDVDAVLLALPLPKGFDERKVLAAIAPAKDVEGLTPFNQGRLYGARHWAELRDSQAFAPCTALAVIRLLQSAGVTLRGAHAVVIGRSSVVGRPVAHLLTCLDATVTLCHSKTRGLARFVGLADVVVAAVGSPGTVKASMLKKGAVVVDAGINRVKGGIVGDVAAAGLAARASKYTPVPGGVGPVTTAELLEAVVTAAERSLPKR